MVVMTQGIVK